VHWQRPRCAQGDVAIHASHCFSATAGGIAEIAKSDENERLRLISEETLKKLSETNQR
jgi:hypothetical protein